MKKILIIPLTILSLVFIPNVKADTTINTLNSEYISMLNSDIHCFGDREINSSSGTCSLQEVYQDYLDYYNENFSSNYDYYMILFDYMPNYQGYLHLVVFNQDNIDSMVSTVTSVSIWFNNVPSYAFSTLYSSQNIGPIIFDFNYDISYTDYSLYDTNYNFTSDSSYEIAGLYQDNIVIDINDSFPKLKDLLEYSSYSDYVSNNNSSIKTVNLDNYHYVLLTLKDYSQTKAFSSNLQVKGMIGITPIYNYGQTEKSQITDRCNISYSDFTDYRLYVLENDLKNNAVYAVKECESGSSFKYDSSIFNITYVTDDNINDPIVTINGQEYHTIPFNQLSNTANKNEENNYVSGSSCQVGDFNCQASNSTSSISDVISSVTDTLQSVWNTLTTFMSLVIRFFNVLPVEIRAIAISTFSIMCVLGIIKFIRGG